MFFNIFFLIPKCFWHWIFSCVSCLQSRVWGQMGILNILLSFSGLTPPFYPKKDIVLNVFFKVWLFRWHIFLDLSDIGYFDVFRVFRAGSGVIWGYYIFCPLSARGTFLSQKGNSIKCLWGQMGILNFCPLSARGTFLSWSILPATYFHTETKITQE